jgi:hypothetical protein
MGRTTTDSPFSSSLTDGQEEPLPPALPLLLPHTFYAVEPSATRKELGTLVCDGENSVEVWVDPRASACIQECVREHEYQHLQDVQERDPEVCKDQPRGAVVGEPEAVERPIELRAYDIELRCLQDEFRKAPRACQPVMKERLQAVKTEIEKRRP